MPHHNHIPRTGTPDSRYPIAESPRSGQIAAATAASLGGLSIDRVDRNADIHPDAFHARNALLGIESARHAKEEEHRIRAYPVQELADRRIAYMALDTQQSGEPAMAGGVYLNTTVGNQEPGSAPFAEIHTLTVEERFGGQGGSARLVGAIATDALMAGYTPFAHAAHPGARNAFERNGFEAVDADEVPTKSLNEDAAAYVLHPGSEAGQQAILRFVEATSLDASSQYEETMEFFFPEEYGHA